MKKCFKCGIAKPLSEFYKHKGTKDGHLNKCKECTKADTSKYFKDNRERYREYDKLRQRNDIHRILNHRYRGIVQRCNGKSSRPCRVNGKQYLSKEEWEDWCNDNMKEFMRLYRIWKASDFDRKYCPSIDRINNNKGYTKDNMQWLSLVENCSKGTK